MRILAGSGVRIRCRQSCTACTHSSQKYGPEGGNTPAIALSPLFVLWGHTTGHTRRQTPDTSLSARFLRPCPDTPSALILAVLVQLNARGAVNARSAGSAGTFRPRPGAARTQRGRPSAGTAVITRGRGARGTLETVAIALIVFPWLHERQVRVCWRS